MKIKKPETPADKKGFKGELTKDKTIGDPTGRYLKNNPFKTPPNNLTTKDRGNGGF